MPKKRERLEVIHDILSAIGAGRMGPTRLLSASNLSPEMFRNYIDELLKKEFIIEIEEKKKKMYQVTKKGFLFLERYMIFSDFVGTLGL
ncbi:MAG: winged helix-turn-helix domain-containing protein [Nanoarchaeota archaeon]